MSRREPVERDEVGDDACLDFMASVGTGRYDHVGRPHLCEVLSTAVANDPTVSACHGADGVEALQGFLRDGQQFSRLGCVASDSYRVRDLCAQPLDAPL